MDVPSSAAAPDAQSLEMLAAFVNRLTATNEMLSLSVAQLSALMTSEVRELQQLYRVLGLPLPSANTSVEQWVARIRDGTLPTGTREDDEEEDFVDEAENGGRDYHEEDDGDDDDDDGADEEEESVAANTFNGRKSMEMGEVVVDDDGNAELDPPVPEFNCADPVIPPTPNGDIINQSSTRRLLSSSPSFAVFVQHVGSSLQHEHGDRALSPTWMAQQLSNKWSALSPSEKAAWERMARLS